MSFWEIRTNVLYIHVWCTICNAPDTHWCHIMYAEGKSSTKVFNLHLPDMFTIKCIITICELIMPYSAWSAVYMTKYSYRTPLSPQVHQNTWTILQLYMWMVLLNNITVNCLIGNTSFPQVVCISTLAIKAWWILHISYMYM